MIAADYYYSTYHEAFHKMIGTNLICLQLSLLDNMFGPNADRVEVRAALTSWPQCSLEVAWYTLGNVLTSILLVAQDTQRITSTQLTEAGDNYNVSGM